MPLIQRIKQQGFRHLLETTFNRFVPPWLFRFSVGEVMRLDLPGLAALHHIDRADDFEFEFSIVDNAADRAELRRVTWNSVLLETTTDDLGYAVRRRGDRSIVGGVWVGLGTFLESNLGFQIELEPNQAWLYCAYLDKSARGGGIYKRLLAHVADDIIARGYQELLVVIQPWNKASMHVHGKYRETQCGRISALRILPLAIVKTDGDLASSKACTTKLIDQPVVIKVKSAV